MPGMTDPIELYLPSDPCGTHDELLAWSLVLPTSGAVTHLTSARERGWWLPPLPDDLSVFAAMAEHESRPQRDGLRVFRTASGPTVERCDGGPLASPRRRSSPAPATWACSTWCC
jgi:hypothetical protein